jgi:TRAP-type transport system periplasmic protein
MSLGDVLPALQQGVIDGSISGTIIYTAMHFQDTAKYVTLTGQPAVFGIVELSKKWYESLPADLQQILDQDAVAESAAVKPKTIAINDNADKNWLASGGEFIKLPPDEQAAMMTIMASVGEDVSKTKPALNAAYKIVTEAAQRTR